MTYAKKKMIGSNKLQPLMITDRLGFHNNTFLMKFKGKNTLKSKQIHILSKLRLNQFLAEDSCLQNYKKSSIQKIYLTMETIL